MKDDNKVGGAHFLIREINANEIFTPEEFNEEHRMIAKTAQEFIERSVMPHMESIEQEDYQLVARLVKEAGELGLLAHYLPETFGGLGLDKVSSAIVNEATGKTGAYGIAHVNHTGIATLPIYYFGTRAQQERYLPKLASGKFVGAYCLTEPSGGSDSLAAKTTARLNDQGTHYILNGSKQFITNAGFSDTFIVYAKVDGEYFTAFIVEKAFQGLSLGPEEKKMGMKGSSTRTVILEDCLVPVENLLGEIGKGHHIAFNVLNIGRYNVGIGGLGGSKYALELAARYAAERKQFGKPLAHFPAIQEKLANMAIRTYALESMQYRTAQHLEDAFSGMDETKLSVEFVDKSSEFALECSICKVFGSETMDQVVDEAVQIHGGYGYIKEYPIEKIYRDSRINRIWEGTNEINRMIIPNMLARKEQFGHFPLQEAIVKAISTDRTEQSNEESASALSEAKCILQQMKNTFLRCLGLSYQYLGKKLSEEQELAMRLADICTWVYVFESSLLRTAKSVERNGVDKEQLKLDLTMAISRDAVVHVEQAARYIIDHLSDYHSDPSQIAKWRAEYELISFKGIREKKRDIAARIVEAAKYVC